MGKFYSTTFLTSTIFSLKFKRVSSFSSDIEIFFVKIRVELRYKDSKMKNRVIERQELEYEVQGTSSNPLMKI